MLATRACAVVLHGACSLTGQTAAPCTPTCRRRAVDAHRRTPSALESAGELRQGETRAPSTSISTRRASSSMQAGAQSRLTMVTAMPHSVQSDLLRAASPRKVAQIFAALRENANLPKATVGLAFRISATPCLTMPELHVRQPDRISMNNWALLHRRRHAGNSHYPQPPSLHGFI